jgi:predicted enzyme related to lactoylglutathione lyase
VLQVAVPILPSRDLNETLAFYERLGFESRGAPHDVWNYLIIGRDTAHLHFYLDRNVDPLTTPFSCFLFVDDADALYAEWRAGGATLVHAPETTDYAMREFALSDPSGNLVRVGSPLDA